MALTQLANQVEALKASIETALQTALDKNEAIAAAAYAKALETLVKPDGVYSQIAEADAQIARVTAVGDAQIARLDETIVTEDITASADANLVYLVVSDATITIPDDRPQGWRITFLTATGVTLTVNPGNNTITGLPGGDTPVLGERQNATLRAVSANTFEVY